MRVSALPHVFQVEITSVCSMKCGFCPHPTMQRPKAHMEPWLFKEIAHRYTFPGQRLGLYMMGEPLLHPNFYEFVEYAASLGVIPEIATNSLALSTPQAQNDLLSSKLSYVIMDISEWKERPEVMARAIRNVCITATEAAKRVANGQSVPTLAFQIVSHAQHPQDFPTVLKDVAAIYPQKFLLKRKFLDTWAGQLKELYDHTDVRPPAKRTPCHEPFNRVAILHNGDVVPCCRDALGLLVYGNLLTDGPLDYIWNGPVVQGIRKKMMADQYETMPEPCRSCKEWGLVMDRHNEKGD